MAKSPSSCLLLLADAASAAKNERAVDTSDACVQTEACQADDCALDMAPHDPSVHDYVRRSDFDWLVNATHDYYSRVLPADDCEHSYAFPPLPGADAAADDDCCFESVANLDEFMGLGAGGVLSADIVQQDGQESDSSLPIAPADDVSRLFGDIRCIQRDDAVFEVGDSDFDHLIDYLRESEQHCANVSASSAWGGDHVVCRWTACEWRGADVAALSLHVEQTHVPPPRAPAKSAFVCRWFECDRVAPFDRRYMLLRHVRVHTKEKPFACGRCDKSFPTADRLAVHTRFHTDERRFACSLCGRAFSSSGDRARHVNTHRRRSPLVCPVDGCSKQYADRNALSKHARLKHFVKPVQSAASVSAVD